jgi:hypothetical protein
MYISFISINFILLIYLIVVAFRKKQIIRTLPILTWTTFIVIPLIYSWRYFPQPSRELQATGVTLISIFLSVGVLSQIKIKELKYRTYIMNKNMNYFLYLLGFLLVITPFYHYLSVGYIPLINKLFGNYSILELRAQRENYNKFAMPYLFSIFSNILVNILAPFFISKLFKLKKYILGLSFLFWVLFYSLSSNSRDSTVIFISTLIIIRALQGKHKIRNHVTALFSIALLLTIIFGITHGSNMIKNMQSCPIPFGVQETPGNINRSCSPEAFEKIRINPLVDTIGYRVFLTPIEVSNNWYQYYSNTKNSYRSIIELTNRDISASAANAVGIEFYKKNFPSRYGSSISAFSSIDADAFSFGGLIYILLVGFLLLMIQIILGAYSKSSSDSDQIFYAIGLSQITFLPWQASIQAMLFSQGLILVLLIAITRSLKLKFSIN